MDSVYKIDLYNNICLPNSWMIDSYLMTENIRTKKAIIIISIKIVILNAGAHFNATPWIDLATTAI